jgi:hypothetical protein
VKLGSQGICTFSEICEDVCSQNAACRQWPAPSCWNCDPPWKDSLMDVLRTPDDRFADLPGYAFAPHYSDTLEGYEGLGVHYVDEGPREAPQLTPIMTTTAALDASRSAAMWAGRSIGFIGAAFPAACAPQSAICAVGV